MITICESDRKQVTSAENENKVVLPVYYLPLERINVLE